MTSSTNIPAHETPHAEDTDTSSSPLDSSGRAQRPRLPGRVQDALVGYYKTWQALRRRGEDMELDAEARWVQDSNASTVRGGGGTPRRLVCSSQDFDLILHILPSKQPGCVDVIGQILPYADADLPSAVELWQGADHMFQAGASETGEFNCRDVPEGDYAFFLSGPHDRGLLLAPASLRAGEEQ